MRFAGLVFSIIVISTFFIGAIMAQAQEMDSQRMLLALSKEEHTLSIIDPKSLELNKTIPVGEDSHEIAVSADGKTAYVANTGRGQFHEMHIVDLENEKLISTFDTMPLYGLHGLQYKQGKLWFTAQGSKAIGRYDPATNKIDLTLGTGQETTHLLFVNNEATRIAATNVHSGTISVFDYQLVQPHVPPTGKLPPGAKAQMEWVHTIIPVDMGVEGFSVSSNEKELWAATPQGDLYVVDLDSKEIIEKISARIDGAHRVAITPDDKKVIIVSVKTGDFVVYDRTSREEIGKIQICHGAGLLVDDIEPRVFVACTPDNYISIVDLEEMREVAKLDVGGRPDGMAWYSSSRM